MKLCYFSMPKFRNFICNWHNSVSASWSIWTVHLFLMTYFIRIVRFLFRKINDIIFLIPQITPHNKIKLYVCSCSTIFRIIYGDFQFSECLQKQQKLLKIWVTREIAPNITTIYHWKTWFQKRQDFICSFS